MKLPVKLRRTAWLLTLFLSVLGCFGTPAATAAVSRSSYSVVYHDKSGKPNIPWQEIAKSSLPVARPLKTAPVIAHLQAYAPAAILDASLFQRPPPHSI